MGSSIRFPARCKAVLLGALWLLLAAESAAQGTAVDLAEAQNCAEILVQAPDNALLTREEKIALLDKALLQSLNNFDPCDVNANAADSNVAGGAGGGVQGTQGETEAQENEATESASNAPVESLPAADIQGDLPAAVDPGNAEETAADKTPISGNIPPSGDMPPNGTVPEDIPPAENDDIIAQQFRQAAMEETDPVAKAKLWNEYRRYQNLPVQEAPET